MRLSADIGGTFTDVVGWDPSTAAFTFVKVPTTPEDPAQGVLDGIAALATRLGTDYETLVRRTERFVHGTTVATNTLAEGTGPLLGLITTHGFRDVLELRDGGKSERYVLRIPFPPALIRRDLRVTVAERVLWDGTVEIPLDEAAVEAACARLRAAGVEGIVIALLHAHMNPAHELRAEAIVRACGWTGDIVLSHQVYNRQGEYARFSTAAVNAYVTPRLAAYLGHLKARLTRSQPAMDVSIVQSSGGLMPVEMASKIGVGCVTSGPAGGAIACQFAANAMGLVNAVAFDIGGTTTDISLIEDGRVVEREKTQNDAYIVAAPSIDIRVHAIGGGSIAAVDRGGILGVGPRSSGARPGPAAYGRGGTNATVTDAAVVLGYFETGRFDDGRLTLIRELAEAAIRRDIAAPLGLSLEDAALAVYQLAAAKVAEGVRSAVVGRGTDPREIDLIAFGGAGGLYVDSVMTELGMTRAIAPRAASVFSAFGFLAGRVRFDEGRTLGRPLAEMTPADLRRVVREIEDRVAGRLQAAGFAREAMRFEWTLDCRYEKQTGTVDVKPSFSADGELDLERIAQGFEARYESLYSHRHPGQPCIVEACRITGTGRYEEVTFPRTNGRADSGAALRGHRNVYSDGAWIRTPVYDFEALRPESRIEGPALLESTSTTIAFGGGAHATIDAFGSLLLTRDALPLASGSPA